eukprot:scaffold94570_cov16-Tisochrysis_lutea.AAC.1
MRALRQFNHKRAYMYTDQTFIQTFTGTHPLRRIQLEVYVRNPELESYRLVLVYMSLIGEVEWGKFKWLWTFWDSPPFRISLGHFYGFINVPLESPAQLLSNGTLMVGDWMKGGVCVNDCESVPCTQGCGQQGHCEVGMAVSRLRKSYVDAWQVIYACNPLFDPYICPCSTFGRDECAEGWGFKQEQEGTHFVWVGSREGGLGGGWIRGLHTQDTNMSG